MTKTVNELPKIKLFTHDDLDGIGCIVVAQSAFKNLDYEICNHDNINNNIEQFLQSIEMHEYDKIFITDISVNERVATMIDEYNKEMSNIQLIDHHPTALWLNKYDWANVQIEGILPTTTDESIHKFSGTYLFKNALWIQNNEALRKFVELVREYDTWEWQINNNFQAKQLNDLFGILGVEKFLKEINTLLENDMQFTDTHKLLLDLEQEKIDNYIKGKNDSVIKQDLNIQNQIYHVGIVFAEKYISELGNRLCILNPDIDFAIIINMSKSVSYRGTKDNINLGQIAKVFGGGGHPKASGSSVNDDIRQLVINNIFK